MATAASNKTAQTQSGNPLSQAVSSVVLTGADKAKATTKEWTAPLEGYVKHFRQKNITSIEKVFQDWTKGGLLGGFLGAGGLASKLGIDADTIKSYVDSVQTGINYAQQGMQTYKDFKNGSYENLLNMTQGLVGDGLVDMAKYGLSTYKTIKATDWSSWESIMSLASSITGIDIGTTLGINQIVSTYASLVAVAQQYGIADALGLIRDEVSSNPYVSSILATGLETNAIAGDIDTIDEVLMILNGSVVGELKPSMVATILSNYQFPLNYDSSKLTSLQEQLIRVLGKIDSSWDREVINGVTYFKLSPWVSASSDAISLMGGHKNYGSCILEAPSYPEMSLKEALNETYTYLALSTSS